eukprot:scaffold33820_cov51-Attheya_sp.AAC.1
MPIRQGSLSHIIRYPVLKEKNAIPSAGKAPQLGRLNFTTTSSSRSSCSSHPTQLPTFPVTMNPLPPILSAPTCPLLLYDLALSPQIVMLVTSRPSQFVSNSLEDNI